MKCYMYEMHLHTTPSSACGRTPGAGYIKPYMEKGYSGIFVTDHFFRGNSGVPRNLPWEQRIDLYCRGYEEAKEEGDRLGFDVFFGIEENFHGDEYLIYGPDKEWLKAHPDMCEWSHEKLHAEIRKAGGVMIQAHPFRDRDYLTAIRVHPECVDGFEAYNMCNRPYSDCYAYAFASSNGIRMTSGSDIHCVDDLELLPGGLCFNSMISSSKDLAKRILSTANPVALVRDDAEAWEAGLSKLNDDNYGFVTYTGRTEPDAGNTCFTKEIMLADKNGKEHSITKEEILEVNYDNR